MLREKAGYMALLCVYVCVCMSVCVQRQWGESRRVSGAKCKQRAVLPLAAKVLLPQHESQSMCYHI